MKTTCLATVACMALVACNLDISTDSAHSVVSEKDYVDAELLLSRNLLNKVKNEKPEARWIGTTDEFWYRRDAEPGFEYLVVDAETGIKRHAFDHQRLAVSLGLASGVKAVPDELQISRIESDNQYMKVTAILEDSSFECGLHDYQCKSKQTEKQQAGVLPSPDGKWNAFVREHNLWLENTETGAETQLSIDGARYFSYGGYPDQYRLGALRANQESELPPANTYWSPDGHRLITQRLDEREVRPYPFLESVPHNGSVRPHAYTVRIPLLGDVGQSKVANFLFDAESGERREIKLPHGYALDFYGSGNNPVGWSTDAELLYLIGATEGAKTIRLFEIDLSSGEPRTIIEESESTSVILGHNLRVPPNVRILNDTREVVWFSERDGWGHLYLYDLDTGMVKNQITEGERVDRQIVRLDQETRNVYFIAGGQGPGTDPYYRNVYRASLDGGEDVLLTHEVADHEVDYSNDVFPEHTDGDPHGGSFSPSGRFFVESYSTVATEPQFVLRATQDGQIISELETANATELYEAGWQVPERFTVTSADGAHELSGVLYFPPGFGDDHSYPVIDAIYGGPASIIAARNFHQSYASGYQAASLAKLGFVVFTLDGRGTPYRSKAFREVGFGSFADPQLEDHIAAIRQLARIYPSLDIQRVGIYGHSNGGYLAARALLRHPDVFKVGIASAGPHSFHGLPGTGKPWMGIPKYESGTTERADDTEIPKNYEMLDNARFAAGLQGDLLLICGDMDNTAFPALTLQLVDALIKANKSFDFIYLPGEAHGYFRSQPYVTRRIWDYFVEHLLGTTPPHNYEMKPPR